MSTLDSILSGGGETASAQEQTTEQVTQNATEAAGQTTEGQTGQETETETTEGESGQRVPVAALQAERQKSKRYTEEVSSLRQEIADRDAAWERRIAQLMQAQQPKQEPQQAPDWFENPTEAMRHQMVQQLSPAFDQVNQTLQAIAKDNAIVRFSEEKVTEAETAFLTAMQNRTLDQADYQRVVSSPNRYAAAVQWHQRQLAAQEIGDDPAAFKEKVRAELEAEILAKHGLANGNVQPAPQRAQVMPSNIAGARNVGARTGPAWSGPQSIADIFAR